MEKREQLIEDLRQFREKRGISNNRIAGAIGISSAVLSQYLNNSYNGVNERVDELVEGFLEREKEKNKINKKEIIYVKTLQLKRIYESLRMAHLECDIAVVYGESGNGKTTAVKYYVNKHKESILIEADLSYTTKVFMRELHKKLGYNGDGSIHDMFEDISEKLKDTGRMLIIDEAEHLPYRALELIRRLHDKDGIGIALVGMPKILYNLRGKRGEFAQLYSRVGIACKASELNEKDTEDFVHSYLPGSNGLWEVFYKECNGNCRHLEKLIYRSKRLAEINNKKIDKQIIKSAAEMLLI